MTTGSAVPLVRPSPEDRSPIRRFVAGAAIDSFGTGISATAAILYFVTVVGFRAEAVALAMSAGAVLGMVSPIPSGRLADRYGLFRVYVALLVLRGVVYLAYPFTRHYPLFVALTCLLMALETTTPPLQQTLVGRILPEELRVRTMSIVSATRNTGFGCGALVAGAALTAGSPVLVAVFLALNGVSFLALSAVVLSLRSHARPAPSGEGRGAAPGAGAPPVVRNVPFLGMSAMNGLLLLHDSVLFVLFPLWAVTRLGVPAGAVPVLLALNTVLSVVLQVVFSRMPRLARSPGPVLAAAVAFLVAACGVGALAEQTRGDVIVIAACAAAVLLLTIGENLHTVAGWQVSFSLAPEARRSEYLAAFTMGYGLQRMIGPALMTLVVLESGTAGWLALGLIFVAAAIGFGAAARVQHARREQEG